MIRIKRCTLAVVLLTVAGVAASALPAVASQPGPGLSDPFPASSSTPAPPPSTVKPPPCAFGLCVPWVWYQATRVVNNAALLPIPAFGVSLDNSTSDPAMLTDKVTGSIQVSAQLVGKFTVSMAPSASSIAGGAAELDAALGAQAKVAAEKDVEITVPPGDQGVIEFGVPAVLVDGIIHTRGILGKVTSTPAQALVPLYPTVFGFSAHVQPLV